MPEPEHFYTCSLRRLVYCYWDCEAWLQIIHDAEIDENQLSGNEDILYGVDYCDLQPYVQGEAGDSAFRLSRADMVKELVKDPYGRVKLVVPPATLLEYVHGALLQAASLRAYLRQFDTLKACKSVEEFERFIMPTYEKARVLLAANPGNAGLLGLQKVLEGGELLTLEQAIPSARARRSIATHAKRPADKGYELLLSRRRGKEHHEFSCMVDMANWDLFLAASEILRGENTLSLMTTSGNLTLKAFRDSAPWLAADDVPCRHLATPYVWHVLRADEPAKPARLRKLGIAEYTLKEMCDEIEKTPEAKGALCGRIDNISPGEIVGVTRRLYNANRAWLDLIYFPYLKRIQQPTVGEEPKKDADITTVVDWTKAHRAQLERGAAQPSREVACLLLHSGALGDEDIRERFVPRHREADRILKWLES